MLQIYLNLTSTVTATDEPVIVTISAVKQDTLQTNSLHLQVQGPQNQYWSV